MPEMDAQRRAAAAAWAAAVRDGRGSGGAGSSTSDDDRKCGGCCLMGAFDFVGAARARPDRDEPEGGWGHTACCDMPVHFDCLGKWMNALGHDIVDSTSGPKVLGEREDGTCVIECPICKSKVGRTVSRMFRAVS